jgi:hypothetical protein
MDQKESPNAIGAYDASVIEKFYGRNSSSGPPARRFALEWATSRLSTNYQERNGGWPTQRPHPKFRKGREI